MSTLKSNTIEPATGTDLTLGAAGDLISVSSDALQLNTWKDSGGNTLFTSDGAGTLSSVNSALDIAAGPVLIQSQTVTAAASCSFTTGIDSTYDHHMFVWYDVRPATDATNFTFQGSVNAGGAYAVSMQTHAVRCYHLDHSQNSGNLLYDTSSDQANGTAFQKLAEELENGNAGNSASEGLGAASGIMHLYGLGSTTYAKQFYCRAQNYYSGMGTNDIRIGGYFNTTSAINAFQFKMSSGNITNATIKLYGIK